MVLIAALEGIAMATGTNGTALSVVVAVLAGLGGYAISLPGSGSKEGSGRIP